MTAKSTQTLLAEALRLDRRARADLASELIARLDGPEDEGVTQAWEEEIQRRLADLESGRTTLIPWEEVRQRIENTLKR
jgi:putative addiction module component (TIGR02574 family)